MATVLAVAAVFAAGLTVLPSTVQDAQASNALPPEPFDITDVCADNFQLGHSQVKCENFFGIIHGDE